MSAQMDTYLVVITISCLIIAVLCVATQSREFFNILHVDKDLSGEGIVLANLLHHLFVVSFIINIHGLTCTLAEQVMSIVYIAEKMW